MADRQQAKKIFVIDTNVFIHRHDAILSFKDSEIVIPLWVLEELDKLKTYSDERGRNARHAVRFLDERAKHGRLAEGVKIENNSILRVALDYDQDQKLELKMDKADNKIILTALSLQNTYTDREVFFVSKDINARVKAGALGLKAVDYEKQKVSFSQLYSGFQEGAISREKYEALKRGELLPWNDELTHNQFLYARIKDSDEFTVCRYDTNTKSMQFVPEYDDGVSGIFPLNPQQQMAFDLLLDDEISLVTLVGKAGTGKTLLALAAGLKKVFNGGMYNRVLASRPIMPLGKDLGFLPGSKEEKLGHWMKPLYDNLELITSQITRSEFKSVDSLMKSKKIEIEAITYIRGRSLPKQFIIVDEAQNLSPHEIKTIVSRAGKGTKVVLTGDPYQIDTPYLDSDSNGLTYLVEAFKGQNMYGHITLEKSERSELAELAAELL